MFRLRTICSAGVICTMAAWSGLAMAADEGVKEEVVKAAKSLEEKGNYSWKTTTNSAGQSRFRPGPTEGKTEKGGFTTLSMTLGDNTLEAVLKGDKGAIKGPDGWRSFAEVSADDSQDNRGRFLPRMLQNTKAPAAQAADLASKAKELKKSDDAITGDLTAEGVKELLTFRRGNTDGPAPQNTSGSVKFWVKDGVLSKYEYHVKGTMTFNNNDINIDRTTTVEIKDVDSTKLNVPEEAKSKAS